MGIKKLKEYFDIKHAISIKDKGVCIGSAYISDIIIINLDGTCAKRYSDRSNEDLVRYQAAFDANPSLVKRLLEEQDEFAVSIPVYTFEGSQIIENLCEVPGWPNTTHDGKMMYANSYSVDKNIVISFAKKDANARCQIFRRRVKELETDLRKLRAELEKAEKDLQELEQNYPTTQPPPVADDA